MRKVSPHKYETVLFGGSCHLQQFAALVGRRGISVAPEVEGARREVGGLGVADIVGPFIFDLLKKRQRVMRSV